MCILFFSNSVFCWVFFFPLLMAPLTRSRKDGRHPHAAIVEMQAHDNLSPKTNAGVSVNESGHS